MGTVVDDLAGTCHGTCLKEVDSYPLPSLDAEVGPHTVRVQVTKASFRYVIVRETGYELGVNAVVGKRYGHICLSAAEGGVIGPGLGETKVSRGGETKHDLPESYDFWHVYEIIS